MARYPNPCHHVAVVCIMHTLSPANLTVCGLGCIRIDPRIADKLCWNPKRFSPNWACLTILNDLDAQASRSHGPRGVLVPASIGWIRGAQHWIPETEGLFGRDSPAPDSLFSAPLHQKFSKHSRSTKSGSTKMVDLEARFIKLVELLRGCSTNSSLVELGKITHQCHWLHK